MRLHLVETGQPRARPACKHPPARNSVCRIATADGSNTHYRLQGDFDLGDAQQLFDLLVQDAESATFTIDLSQTSSIDAGILGAFVRLARKRREVAAAPVRICNASGHIRKLFSICELDRLLDCWDPICSPRP
jgi:anti-anti-sigma factor